ncbi:HNH endonuclease family protein [Corynebacterium mastitidis]|uniref:HNH endonuclease family protein n=1 Tax=Corynebacterium mastitidis TaxID=161890 RepID=A0ABU8NYJ9_9CORY
MMRKMVTAAVVTLLCVLGVSHYHPGAVVPGEVSPGEVAPGGVVPGEGGAPAGEEYLARLDSLPVKGRAPMTGYSREAFGQAWSDDVEVDGGHNGCDTRNDILRRDLTGAAIKPGTRGCVVASGVLQDPYSGRPIDFVRGVDSSRAVQIDHVVALADAWVKGAQQLDERARRNLANDPLNLLAVDGGLNNQKEAGDAATWLPPNKAFRCEYGRRQVDVKQRYGLWVTPAERDALAGILAQC